MNETIHMFTECGHGKVARSALSWRSISKWSRRQPRVTVHLGSGRLRQPTSIIDRLREIDNEQSVMQ